MNNSTIRRIMKKYIKKYGPQDTRVMIDKFSKFFTQQNSESQVTLVLCAVLKNL